jgi:hypothetical protein
VHRDPHLWPKKNILDDLGIILAKRENSAYAKRDGGKDDLLGEISPDKVVELLRG